MLVMKEKPSATNYYSSKIDKFNAIIPLNAGLASFSHLNIRVELDFKFENRKKLNNLIGNFYYLFSEV